MPDLSLTLACWDYDRVRPLMDGSVKPQGIHLRIITAPIEEIFWRMLVHQEFDAAEMSMGSYIIARDRGYPKISAIPVFISRFFRHSCIFVNAHAGIEEPTDLRGKRVGVPEYQMTAAVWIRGILQHEYGVHPRDILWFQGGVERPGRKEKPGLALPEGVRVEAIPETKTLNEMLDSGELDALIGARAPSSFLKGSPNVRRLFPDYVKVEKEYYRNTGIFPIMHTIVIKDEILQENLWVANSLYKAFEAAKAQVYRGLNQTGANKTILPWAFHQLEEARALMGEDFWPYGIEKNRKAIETFAVYAYEQGLTSRPLTVEELFVPTTLEDYYVSAQEAY